MYLKFFWALFPPKYFYFLGAALLLYLIPNVHYHTIANFVLHVFLLLFFLKVATLVHELGHAVMALLVKANLNRFVIGKGEVLLRRKIKATTVVFHRNLISGYVLTTYNDYRRLRGRHFLVILGGALFNGLLLLACYYFFGFQRIDFMGERGLILSNPFMIANAFLLINLLPFQTNFYGLKMPSDGSQLLKIAFGKTEKLLELVQANKAVEAYERYEKKEYREALHLYQELLETNSDAPLIEYNVAMMHLKLEEYEKSVTLLLALYERVKEDKQYDTLLCNSLAWAYLLLHDEESLRQADYYSEMAYRAHSRELGIIGTRASVLIEIGKVRQGLDLLAPFAKFNDEGNQNLANCIYMALGNLLIDDYKDGRKYYHFVEEHQTKLDADERRLWALAKDKLKDKLAILQSL